MKILKKNQLVIFVIALMLVTAGYLSYDSNHKSVDVAASTNNFGDASLVDSQNIATGQEALVSNDDMSNTADVSTATTPDSSSSDDYYINSRLDRDKTYSEMLDNYQKIIDDSNAGNDQKNTAAAGIKKINDDKNSIMIAENLIKTKGFDDVVIFINDSNVDVVVKKDKLETADIAQIQDIVTREIKVDISNVHISSK